MRDARLGSDPGAKWIRGWEGLPAVSLEVRPLAKHLPRRNGPQVGPLRRRTELKAVSLGAGGVRERMLDRLAPIT